MSVWQSASRGSGWIIDALITLVLLVLLFLWLLYCVWQVGATVKVSLVTGVNTKPACVSPHRSKFWLFHHGVLTLQLIGSSAE